MNSTTLYRATDGYTGKWSCWALDADDAEAYRDNPGFGGADIVTRDADLSGALDLRDEHGVDFVALAEALGYYDPEETAVEWRMNSWRYPWEESEGVRAALVGLGVEWVLYMDDYPEGADVAMYLGGES